MSRCNEYDEWKSESATVDGVYVEANVHYVGWYTDGDAWGYGCEPSDESIEVVDVEIEVAYNEETGEDVEITEELKQKVMKEVA